MAESNSAARAELAPTGRLRVGLNMSNFLLTAKDPATGEISGVAPDLGRELGRRLGVPVELVPYPSPGALADAAQSGAWDVGFLGAEPQRAQEIDFSPAYVEIEATYLVHQDSPLKAIADVDRAGVRIITNERAAYELWLTRNLKHATLITEKGPDNAFKRFAAEKFDALAGLRPRLMTDKDKLPGSRVLDGHFTAVQQAAGTPKGRPAGAAYLKAFIEDVKASGLVARTIEKNNVRGLTVAARA
jgi:polar amino acid transport system substrate-binding protein